MFNLDNRIRHWSTGYTAKNQGDSPPCPFDDWLEFFEGNVLEIGPGEGRQYVTLKDRPKIRLYAIAEISEQALRSPIYENVQKKFLLRRYDEDLGYRFNVIHFWYVLHHIPRIEIADFVQFLRTHITENGLILFNTPYLDFDQGAYADDGVLTTKYTISEVIDIFGKYFFCLLADGSDWGKSHGYLYIGRPTI